MWNVMSFRLYFKPIFFSLKVFKTYLTHFSWVALAKFFIISLVTINVKSIISTLSQIFRIISPHRNHGPFLVAILDFTFKKAFNGSEFWAPLLRW